MNKFKLLTALLLITLLISGCRSDSAIIFEKKDLGLDERFYQLGISGYSPANFPNSNEEDISRYWKEINSATDIYFVNTDWRSLKIFESTAPNVEKIGAVIGFQTPTEWTDQTDEFIIAIKSLLKKYPKITHLSIGNEVNDLKEKYPSEFSKFIMSYKKIYSEIKSTNPELNIFTTFQYESLIGKGYLRYGNNPPTEDISLIDQFINNLDSLGLTSYPYFDFTTPSEIPDDYFDKLKRFEKQLIFTETAWISRENFTKELEVLNSKGFSSSEEEQQKYLLRLINILPKNTSILSWIFLNDPYSDGSQVFEVFDTVGLKGYNGNSKLIWNYWMSLKNLPKV